MAIVSVGRSEGTFAGRWVSKAKMNFWRFLLLAVTAWGQSESKMTIAGQVVDEVTRKPIGKALVHLEPLREPGPNGAGIREMFTDESGNYSFADLPKQSYRLRAERPHYRQPVTFTEMFVSESTDRREIRLQPLARLAVKVLDRNGNPVPGARVEVLRKNVDRGFALSAPMNLSSTNDLGMIRFYDWPPGNYLVRVAGRGGRTMERVDGEESPSGDFVSLAPESRPVTLRPGETEDVEFRLELCEARRVAGRVMDRAPGQSLRIEALDEQWETLAVQTEVDPVTGRFRVAGLPNGPVTLRAAQRESVEQREGLLVVGSKERQVEIGLRPLRQLPLRVVCAGATAAAGGRMADSPCNATVTLVSRSERVSQPVVGTTEGQTMRLPESGEYRVVVRSLDDLRYPASVTYSGRPVETAKPILIDATAPGALEIEMRPGAAELTVVYPAGKDGTRSVLLLAAEEPGCEGVRGPGVSYWVGSTSQFSLTVNKQLQPQIQELRWQSLPPGHYALYEVKDEELAYQERGILAQRSAIANFHLGIGEKKRLELEAKP